MASPKAISANGRGDPASRDVLTFTLDNPSQDNEVTGTMLDAMLTELRSEVVNTVARVLRIRAR